MKKFSRELASKPRWLVLNKRDLLTDEEAERRSRTILRRLRFRGPHFLVSGATGRGTKELTDAVMAFLEERARAGRGRAAPATGTADASPAST